jgi:uncharacterized protein (TIGR04222 family)
MHAWQDTWIGHLPGPQFLALYTGVIAVVFAWVRWRVWAADRTREATAPDPPEVWDPVDLAFLRGDAHEVLRLIVVELVQRGYLEVRQGKFLGLVTSQKLGQTNDPPELEHLGPLRRRVFDFFGRPRDGAELFRDQALGGWVRAHCQDVERGFREQHLLTPAEVRRVRITNALLGVAVVLLLGGYKLAVAWAKGRTNVGFLVVLGIIGTAAVIAGSDPGRLSRRGRTYVKRLQERFQGLRTQLSRLDQSVDDTGLVFAVALFGFAALEGTPYAGLASSFRQASSSSGCGGGGCGGGGCGGGCGGCGG